VVKQLKVANMDRKPKILIVDDKPENLVALAVVLKDLDIELVKATSGNDALKQTLHHDFALALLDIQMPEMDGYELAGILREEERTANLPFIFISAVYTDNLNVFKGYEKGAFSFITKPFQPEILVNKVKFFINNYQQEIALQNLNEDLHRKNQELESINRELEAFTYSVSHDLRAPLRAINGYTQILSEDYTSALDEEGQRLMKTVLSSTEKMNTLIEELLEFSRLGRQELRRQEIDMKHLTEEVIREISKSMNHAAQIKISELPKVRADRQLIYQVMFNLLSNAIKYSAKKEDPVVEISSEENGSDVVFSVKDNGAGFDMKYAGKLFDVFQRLHSDRDFKGTGVGLAIVQRIVAKHGGRVWGEGKQDEGALFRFSLAKN
jgi:signal transduction histidine kinase